MKIFFAGCVFLLFLSSHCVAQLGQPITVPVLKEDKKIDGLMDMVFKDELAHGQIDKSLSADSCWFIELLHWNNDDNFSFQIVRNKKPVINFRINAIEHHKDNDGYFVYKGNVIFVWSRDNLFYNFFTKTDNYRMFNFIFYANGIKATREELYPNTMHYKYSDGRFSVEGPPTIEQLIK